MSRAQTLGELKTAVRNTIEDVDSRWLTEGGVTQLDQALQRAYACVLPLGIRAEVSGQGTDDEFIINDFVTRIERCRIVGTFRGVAMPQELPLPSLRLSQDGEGNTRVRFPYALTSNHRIEIIGMMQPPFPTIDGNKVEFPWPELLVTYAVAELFAMRTEHGTTVDMDQFSILEKDWRMKADMMKQDILASVGVPSADTPEKKPAPKDKKK